MEASGKKGKDALEEVSRQQGKRLPARARTIFRGTGKRAMNCVKPGVRVASGAFLAIATACAAAEGDAERGAKVFQACMACHSLEAGQHMTGPSLASIWGRKAGTVEGFRRYSDVLKHSGTVWDEKSLDDWLRDPAAFIPGNQMAFQGLQDARTRSDVIAFLKAASKDRAPAVATGGGMMGGPRQLDLKKVDVENRVAAIRYCADSYFVTTANGEKLAFWEFNLRFKTDSSSHGPARGQPVLVPAGMMGDRAQVVFSNPSEISGFIRSECRER